MPRPLLADFFVSLDGFASQSDGTQDFTFPFFGPQTVGHIGAVLQEPHVIVMGRRTYEIMAAFWPGADAPQAAAMNGLPKLVFSRTLRGPLTWSNARLAERGLVEELTALKQQDGPPLRTIGSIGLVREMMRAGLVDRVRLMVFPVVLGREGAQPVFGDHARRDFDLVGTRTLDGRTLSLEYRPA